VVGESQRLASRGRGTPTSQTRQPRRRFAPTRRAVEVWPDVGVVPTPLVPGGDALLEDREVLAMRGDLLGWGDPLTAPGGRSPVVSDNLVSRYYPGGVVSWRARSRRGCLGSGFQCCRKASHNGFASRCVCAMLIGYARASTDGQDAAQVAALRKAARQAA
jgi:hypothetical protein